LASTDFGPRTGWLEMSSLDRPVRRAIYLTVLSASDPSPLLPETGEEPHAPNPDEAPKRPEKPGPVTVKVDIARISQRILALRVPSGDYSDLNAGAAGSVYYLEPMSGAAGPGGGFRLQRFQLKDRAAAPFLEGVRSYTLSGDNKKLLYQAGGNRWGVVA